MKIWKVATLISLAAAMGVTLFAWDATTGFGSHARQQAAYHTWQKILNPMLPAVYQSHPAASH